MISSILGKLDGCPVNILNDFSLAVLSGSRHNDTNGARTVYIELNIEIDVDMKST